MNGDKIGRSSKLQAGRVLFAIDVSVRFEFFISDIF